MSGDSGLFSEIEEYKGGKVTFGDDSKGKIIGIGKIGKGSNLVSPVYLVKGLKYNLLNISQLCDKGQELRFTQTNCYISDGTTKETKLSGKRSGNTYTIPLFDPSQNFYLKASLHDDSWT